MQCAFSILQLMERRGFDITEQRYNSTTSFGSDSVGAMYEWYIDDKEEI